MKKNLIALAIFGAFSGAALAQSNVTLYGIVDVNYQYNDPDAPGTSATSGINSGHQSGSRWGIRGSEALSPNLNAVFTLEGGMDVSTGIQGTGSQNGKLFGRQAWGGLSGNWGTAVLGRVATFSSGTGSFDMFGNIDPFVTGFGDSSLGSTFTPSGALRLDNSALYQSPTFGGFKFGAGYSFNVNGPEVAGTGNNIKATFLGVSWGAGPFYAAVTYDSISPSQIAIAGTPPTAAAPLGTVFVPPNADDQNMLQVGGTWDLKFVKLHAAYAREKSVYYPVGFATLQPDAGADADAWMFGVTIPLFGGSILASYQDRNGDNAALCLASVAVCTSPAQAAATVERSRDVSVWAIAYTYPLSRRTNLYINYSSSDIEIFSRPITGPLSGFTQLVEQGRNQYTMGIRHLF